MDALLLVGIVAAALSWVFLLTQFYFQYRSKTKGERTKLRDDGLADTAQKLWLATILIQLVTWAARSWIS